MHVAIHDLTQQASLLLLVPTQCVHQMSPGREQPSGLWEDCLCPAECQHDGVWNKEIPARFSKCRKCSLVPACHHTAAPHRGLLRSLLLLAVESHPLTTFGRRYYILPERMYSTGTGTTSSTPHTLLLLPAYLPQMAWSGVCVPQSVLPLNVGIHCVGVHVLMHMGMCAMPGVDIKLF